VGPALEVDAANAKDHYLYFHSKGMVYHQACASGVSVSFHGTIELCATWWCAYHARRTVRSCGIPTPKDEGFVWSNWWRIALHTRRP
jgi:hypothetical protein